MGIQWSAISSQQKIQRSIFVTEKLFIIFRVEI